jgi:hypothetical protein
MDVSHIWKRIEDGEKTGAVEAWKLLRSMLEDARDRDVNEVEAIETAAITVVSAIDRLDQRETERDTLLYELRSERGRCRELDELLARMLDPHDENRMVSIRSALDEVDAIETPVRVSESAFARPSEPAPPPPEPDVEQRNRRFALFGCGAVLMVVVLLLVFKIVSEQKQTSNPTAAEVVEGAQVELLTPAQEAGDLRMQATWASRSLSASSSWRPPERALGQPDLYLDPELDSGMVWTPRSDDRGTEFLEVAWNYDITVKSVVIVEGPNAGAIVAVDEIQGVDENKLGSSDYVRLWSGTMEASSEPRFTLIHLREARPLRGLRLVLDTSLVAGENSIDAVGLLTD